MSVDSAWSDPVAIWWVCLVGISAANIALFVLLLRLFRASAGEGRSRGLDLWLLLCAAYVFGCAFRAALPRADIQRICLFDTWLSTVLIGRSVATVAELCFALQWTLVLRHVAILTRSDTALNISRAIAPMILVAEGCSWYAVITTDYLGNVLENSLWAAAFLLVTAALVRFLPEFRGPVRFAIAASTLGLVGYVAFMVKVDIPMYLGRWHAQETSGAALLGLVAGLHDLGTRLVVTRDIAQWRGELAWMSLYFSVAVWSSLALCAFPLVHHRLPGYRTWPMVSAMLPPRSRSA